MKAVTAFATLFLLACQAQVPTDAAADNAPGAQGLDVPTPPLLAIGQVQGRGPRSALVDQQVTIQGVVVGNFSRGLQGVFVQSERDDGDPATSEGIFVVHGVDAEPTLHTGDRVRVSGRVVEEGDDRGPLTALRDVVIEVIGASGVRSTVLDQAPESAADWERYEGMALRIAAPLTVSDNRSLTRYGEITASFGGRLFNATEIAMPGPAAEKVRQDNARRTLLLDDNRTSKDPRNLWFLKHELDDKRPMRAGSRLLNVTGVLDQRRGDYRLQLTEKLEVRQAPRPTAPKVPGDVRIVSMNMLNLFNGDGSGGGFPTERGADTFEQYQRQQQKLVAVVQALAPDVAALMEVENDGSGPDSTLAQFVQALNAAGPARDYRLVDSGDRLGGDSIRVAMIYRAGRVALQGKAVSLTGGPFASRSRVPLAQAFRAGSGPVFVVAANHFKSKGCGHDEDKAQGPDADQHDGQSCWNAVRVTSAEQLLQWLASDPTGHPGAPQMIVGDLNAHAMEDPIRLLREAGWQDALVLAKVPYPYSFVFDGQAGRLDHALLNAPMADRLRDAAEWHNNSDETDFFDYHQDQEADPYRASDHDPILLGFDLGRQQL